MHINPHFEVLKTALCYMCLNQQDKDFRIFILMMYGGSTAQLLCKVCNISRVEVCYNLVLVHFYTSQAYDMGIKYPTHVIMHPAWYGGNWYKNPLGQHAPVNCTVEERLSVLEYTLGVQIFEFIEDYDAVADTGIVSVFLEQSLLKESIIHSLFTCSYSLYV